MDKYEKIARICKIEMGDIFIVKDNSTSQKFIMKRIFIDEREYTQMQPENEARLLEQLDHPNIIKMREHFYHKKYFCLIMEYAEKGDLDAMIKRLRKKEEYLSEQQVMDLFCQLCLAVSYLHGKNYIHRDIKIHNIFLTSENIVKLGDFGISIQLENTQIFAKTQLGTPYYLSPEVVQGKNYDQKVDIWMMGCFLYEICELARPFQGKTWSEVDYKIQNTEPEPIDEFYSPFISNLVKQMLSKDPKMRPSINDILNEPQIIENLKQMSNNEVYSQHLIFPDCIKEDEDNLNDQTVIKDYGNSSKNVNNQENMKKEEEDQLAKYSLSYLLKKEQESIEKDELLEKQQKLKSYEIKNNITSMIQSKEKDNLKNNQEDKIKIDTNQQNQLQSQTSIQSSQEIQQVKKNKFQQIFLEKQKEELNIKSINANMENQEDEQLLQQQQQQQQQNMYMIQKQRGQSCDNTQQSQKNNSVPISYEATQTVVDCRQIPTSCQTTIQSVHSINQISSNNNNNNKSDEQSNQELHSLNFDKNNKIDLSEHQITILNNNNITQNTHKQTIPTIPFSLIKQSSNESSSNKNQSNKIQQNYIQNPHQQIQIHQTQLNHQPYYNNNQSFSYPQQLSNHEQHHSKNVSISSVKSVQQQNQQYQYQQSQQQYQQQQQYTQKLPSSGQPTTKQNQQSFNFSYNYNANLLKMPQSPNRTILFSDFLKQKLGKEKFFKMKQLIESCQNPLNFLDENTQLIIEIIGSENIDCIKMFRCLITSSVTPPSSHFRARSTATSPSQNIYKQPTFQQQLPTSQAATPYAQQPGNESFSIQLKSTNHFDQQQTYAQNNNSQWHYSGGGGGNNIYQSNHATTANIMNQGMYPSSFVQHQMQGQMQLGNSPSYYNAKQIQDNANNTFQNNYENNVQETEWQQLLVQEGTFNPQQLSKSGFNQFQNHPPKQNQQQYLPSKEPLHSQQHKTINNKNCIGNNSSQMFHSQHFQP